MYLRLILHQKVCKPEFKQVFLLAIVNVILIFFRFLFPFYSSKNIRIPYNRLTDYVL